MSIRPVWALVNAVSYDQTITQPDEYAFNQDPTQVTLYNVTSNNHKRQKTHDKCENSLKVSLIWR